MASPSASLVSFSARLTVRGEELFGSEYHFLQVGAAVVHLQDLVHQVVRERGIDGVNLEEKERQVRPSPLGKPRLASLLWRTSF